MRAFAFSLCVTSGLGLARFDAPAFDEGHPALNAARVNARTFKVTVPALLEDCSGSI